MYAKFVKTLEQKNCSLEMMYFPFRLFVLSTIIWWRERLCLVAFMGKRRWISFFLLSIRSVGDCGNKWGERAQNLTVVVPCACTGFRLHISRLVAFFDLFLQQTFSSRSRFSCVSRCTGASIDGEGEEARMKGNKRSGAFSISINSTVDHPRVGSQISSPQVDFFISRLSSNLQNGSW